MGARLGFGVGCWLGFRVGDTVGNIVGFIVSTYVGARVRANIGARVGENTGLRVGFTADALGEVAVRNLRPLMGATVVSIVDVPVVDSEFEYEYK